MPLPLRLFEPEQEQICPAELGGKAQGLWQLQQAGLPVPGWKAIPIAFFDHYLERPGLSQEKLTQAWQEGPKAWASLNNMWETGKPQEVSELLNDLLSEYLLQAGDRAWAIRSSSSWEDQSNQSFAGLFKTLFLGPPDFSAVLDARLQELKTAICSCWRSIFSELVWHYGTKNRLKPETLKMCVIVQELKMAESSGVWFDVHPQRAYHEALLIAGHGMGEGIVQSKVETDSWIYHKTKKSWHASISKKEHHYIMGPEGLYCATRPPSIEPCLSQGQLDQFLDLLTLHKEHFTIPQDIEWCLDQEGFWFLQSRPITTLPPGAPLRLDASNIKESYPGVITPLTFSVVRRGYAVNLYHTLALLGMSKDALNRYHPQLMQMIALVNGRIYYNRGQWQSLFSLLPGLAPSAQESFAEMIGSQHLVTAPEQTPLSLWRVYPRLLFHLANFSFRHKRFCQNIDALISQFEKTPLQDKSNADLILLYQQQFENIVSQLAPGLLNDLWLSLCSSWTKKYYQRHKPVQDINAPDNWSQLLAGISDLPSKNAMYQVLDLLPELRSNKALYQRLNTAVTEESSPDPWLATDWPQWYAKTQTYLQRYGFRVADEFLLENPSFIQEPLKLYQWLLQLSQQDLSTTQLKAQEAQLQKQTQTIISAFPWPQSMILKLGLKRCFQAIRRREQVRLFRARMMASARRFFLELAQAFQRQGILQKVEDIFYLNEAEIMDLAQQQAFHEPENLIQSRKEKTKIYQGFDPGDYYACFAPHFLVSDLPAQAEPTTHTGLWQGQGCGGGKIRGEVLIATGLPDPAASQDKILIVMTTDPGWMLHLLQARALVSEQGNLLSHAAILGREMGLPTVVGVPGICQQLKTGQWVEINGHKGEVRLLSASEL